MKLCLRDTVYAGFFTMIITTPGTAELIDRGGGLIYDTELDITWLQDANYAKTSGFHNDGLMIWPTAMSWTANLSYYDTVRNQTWTDWRLPSARDKGSSSEPCFLNNCSESELGHLYHIDGINRDSPGPFANFNNNYWSNTGRAPFLSRAWLFAFHLGQQDYTGPLENLLTVFALAVRDGDVDGPVNSSPLATNDNASVDEGLSVTIDLTLNDTDADDGLDLGSIRIVNGPSNGSITAINTDGTVDYTHNGSETTTDSFSYTVSDLSGASSNAATVNIAVNPQNDAPVANDDSAIVGEGDAVNIDLSANDTDVDNALDLTSIAITSQPNNGSVAVNTNGTVDYTLDGSETTTDSFTYTINDADSIASNVATVSVTINPADSNGDGISDIQATALGLDPNDPDGDTDNDAATDVAEVGGDVNNPLDSDADGMIDALEPGASAADANVASGLRLDGGAKLIIETAAGETLSNVSSGVAVGGLAGINFPFGMVSYTTTAPTGGSVTVRMNFSNDLPENLVVFKVDDAGGFTQLEATLWTQVDSRTLEITLTDGDPLTDLDGASNGSIDDPIAVGGATATLASDSTGGGGGGGCTLNAAADKDPTLPLLMWLSLGYLLRRRIVGQK